MPCVYRTAAPRNEEVCLRMSTCDWKTVEELLHEAMALAPEQRTAFLDVACGSDAELRAELNSLLLVGDDLSDEFLDSPLRGVLVREFGEIDSAGALVVGQLFAQRFELIRKLGEGGMGQVWLAEQVTPVRRQVALKLIKAGMYDEAVVQRFQSERQSLAIMDHPAIAKVFDAGTTSQGQPYLVMEYVPGLPITEYCDQHKLNIKDRLELFIQACEGVQHAHQKAIIHRDLKPSNILVIEVDGKPVPRIIDFGLAKTTASQLGGEFTQLGQFIGTPGYMSPEQVSLSARDIDTRTDVYTLGVVLYVLLTGLQPFETKRREKPQLEEWLRQLREEDPPNPSTKVSGDKDTSSATADARRTEPKQLISQLRGDLDWIAMKALDRDRERRYGTPSELAADLRRFLNNEAVMARPASAGYQIRKFVRRHRFATAFIGMVTVLSVVASGAALIAVKQKREAEHQAAETLKAQARLVDMLKVQDEFSLGLVRALQLSMGAHEPRVRPALKSVEGYSLVLKGRVAFDRLDRQGIDQAASYFRQAMELDPESALAPAWLANTYIIQAAYGLMPPDTAYEDGRRYAERSLSLDPQSALAMATLGLVQILRDWDWAAGAARLDRAVALEPGAATILICHSSARRALGQWDAAIRDLNAALALDPLNTAAYFELGVNHLAAGHWSEAEAAFKRTLDIAPNHAFVHGYLAGVLLFKGEKQAALREIDLESSEAVQWVGRAAIYYALGRKADSDAALSAFMKRYPEYAFGIAQIHASRGENDAAFLWLERAFNQKDVSLWHIKSEPLLNSLKGDLRYKAFLKKMNLPD
jgi:tetratricopeptide (TPR) repeat protein